MNDTQFRCAANSVHCGTTNGTDAVECAKFRSRSHDAVFRVYDAADNVIETHEHKGDFREF
jgi:hypothetical protein